MEKLSSARLTTLGIAVVVLAAGLASMTAQAQNPTNNVVQVSPYSDFYSEDDCRDARDQASSALMVEHYRRTGNLTERRAKMLKDSKDIFLDETNTAWQKVRDAVDPAQIRYGVAVAAAMVALIECELAITVTGPAWYKAQAICVAKYVTAVAAARLAYKTVERNALKIYETESENIRLRANARDEDIERACRICAGRIELWHERRLADIESDYQECLEFVGEGN